MSKILVVEPDASYADLIATALQADGWPVAVFGDSAAAQAEASDHPPRLILASGSAHGAKDLLAAFAQRAGGPGALVLLPVTFAGQVSAKDFHADGILTKPFSEDELKHRVRSCLEGGGGGKREPPAASTEQLTSADIFGDVLAEVEAEASRQRPAPPKAQKVDQELEAKLEKTLSGVLDLATASTPPRKKKNKPKDEIDKLLDLTLADIDLPRRSRPRALSDAEAAAPAVTMDGAPTLRIPALEDVGISDLVEDSDLPTPAEEPPSEEVADARESTEDEPEPELEAWAPPTTSIAAPPEEPTEQPREGITFGEYTLLELIATGGMAEVWKARRRGVEGFEKTVAIKKILSHLTGSQDFVSMFIDEAKLAAQLSHNHIIQIYDLGKAGDDFFIAMEYVEGHDLRSILRTLGEAGERLPPPLAALIAARLASALDHAHHKRDAEGTTLGLVHRDVSPQNVLIGFDGNIKLCDFGIVKAVVKASTTQMGALKGKLQYMSPEQAWGRAVDGRSDIFSLGSVFFEALTGRKLFTSDSEIGVLDAVRECELQPLREILPSIPEEVERIVFKALAQSPEDRFQRAGEMSHELEQVLRELDPPPSQGELAAFMRRLYSRPDPEDLEAAGATTAVDAASDDIDLGGIGPDATDPDNDGRSSVSEDGGKAVASVTKADDDGASGPSKELASETPLVEGEPIASKEADPEEPTTHEDGPPPPNVEPTATDSGGEADEDEAPPRSSAIWRWLVIGAILVALIAASFWLLPRGESAPTPPPVEPSSRVTPPAQPPSVEPTADGEVQVVAATPATATPTADAETAEGTSPPPLESP